MLAMRLLILIISCMASVGYSEQLKTITLGPTGVDAIRVGAALSIDQDTGFVRSACPQLRNVAELFTSWLNRVHGGVRLSGTSRPLSVTFVDDRGTTDGVTQATKHLVEDLGIKILLGPASSTLNKPAAAVANSSGALMVTANAASPSVFAGRPKVFGILTPAPVWQKPAVDALATRGAKTIGYMFEDQGFQKALCMALPDFAAAAGMEVVKVISGPTSWRNSSSADAAVREMQAAAPDVVFVCAYEEACEIILKSMRSHNFAPKMAVFPAGLFSYVSSVGQVADWVRFVAGLELWSPDAPLSSPWAGGITAATFAETYFDHYGHSPTWFGSSQWAGLESLVQAMEAANSLDLDKVAAALSATDIQTLYGQVKFNGNRQNINECKVCQFATTSDQPVFVAPMNTEKFIYPMPSWEERKCLATEPADSIYGYSNGSCMACPEIANFSWDEQRRLCESCASDEEAVEASGLRGGLDSSRRFCTKKCSEGWVVNSSGACSPCEKGYIAFQRTCVPCPLGTSSGREGQVECKSCLPGTIGNTTGQTACIHCLAGQFSGKLGGKVCNDCNAGTFSRTQGATQCDMCAFGRYSSVPRSVSCRTCEKGATMLLGSTSVQDCVCPSGQFSNAHSVCEACPEGMVCSLGSDVKNYKNASGGIVGENTLITAHPYPTLKPSYWSAMDNPLSVFQCESQSRCPGGDPGQCGDSLEKASCSHCREGWRWLGNRCAECTSFEQTQILFPIVPLIAGPLIIIFMYRVFGDQLIKWNSWQNGCTATLFVTLNHYQVISLLVASKFERPRLLEDVFGFWDFSTNVLSILHIDCAGFTSLTQSMLVKALGPIVIAVICVVTFGCSVAVSKIGFPPALMEKNRLFNVYGSIIYTFSAAIAAVAMSLFKCSQNPNDTKTLVADLSIICYTSDEWKDMLGIGIVSCILYVVGFMVLLVSVLVRALHRFRDESFQMRWKFLLIKYRPNVWWWSLAFLIKNILLNLSSVIFQTPVPQYLCIYTVTVLYMAAVAYYMPYRSRVVNAVELFSGLSIIYGALVLLAISYQKGDGQEEHTLAVLASILSFTPLVLAAFAMSILRHAFCDSSESKRDKLFQEFKDIRSALTVIESLSEREQIQFLSHLSDWDRSYLSQVWNFITCEIHGGRSREMRVSSKRFNDASNSRLVAGYDTEKQETKAVAVAQEEVAQESRRVDQENRRLEQNISSLKQQMAMTESLAQATNELYILSEATPLNGPVSRSVRTPPNVSPRPASGTLPRPPHGNGHEPPRRSKQSSYPARH